MNQPNAPKWIVRLVQRLLDPSLLDAVLGDLMEEFDQNVSQVGLRKARRQFARSGLVILFQHRLRRKRVARRSIWNASMLGYHIKLSFRQIRKNFLFSAINISGVGFSMVGILLIGFYLTRELSYDHFFSDLDRIYRVIPIYHNSTNDRPMPSAPPALGPLLVNAHGGIEKSARVYISDINNVLGYEDRHFIEKRIFYADSAFLDILDFPLIVGNSETALNAPNTVILSRRHAIKYFGTVDILGKSLHFNEDRTVMVTGVVEVPENSHLQFDVLMSFSTYRVPPGYTDDLTSWRWNGFFTYVKLSGAEQQTTIEQFLTDTWMANQNRDREVTVTLQPVKDIYLGSSYVYHPYFAYHYQTGDAKALYGLIGAGVLLLTITLFNLANLSSAQLTRRFKNITISKILGSSTRSIGYQLLVEALLISFLGVLLAFVGIVIFSDPFETLIGYQLELKGQEVVPFIGIVLLAIVILASVPISVSVLKASRHSISDRAISVKSINRGLSWRSILMIFQLIVTSVLLTATLVMKDQLAFISQRNLGFEKENVIIVEMQGEILERHYERIKTGLSNNPNVTGISRSKYALNGKSGGSPLSMKSWDSSESFGVAVYESHYDFLETLSIEILDGRSFSQSFPTDSANAIILNRTAVEMLGLDVEAAVGQQVRLLDWDKTIVGVVEDFHIASLHGTVRPMAMVMPFTHSTKLLVKLSSGDVSTHISSIQEDWRALLSDVPFDFHFLDDSIQSQYEMDQRFSRLTTTFSTIAIVVALLGLFGVSGFLLQTRLKEAAIRKVLGASFGEIVLLLSKSFYFQMLLSVLISIPVSIYIMQHWLNNFAYAIDLNANSILIALLLVTTLGGATIFYQSSRIAIVNPSKNLRND